MKKYNIDFISKFPIAAAISIILVLGSIIMFATKGLNYGVDFRGGAELQIKFNSSMDQEGLRGSLNSEEFNISSIQSIGDTSENEFLIKIQATADDINKVTQAVSNKLEKDFSGQFNIRKTDVVGPKAGAQLRISGFQAMLWALLAIMIYIGLRFDFKYSPGAIVALLHDVIIIIGIFVLTQKEFSLQIVAALLAIIGYSVNDTVVVYDRVRENEENNPGKDLDKVIDKSINETLSRTIMTSLTTLIVSVIMFIFGGGSIKDFFFAITLGVIIGTYSSVFVASPTILFFDKFLNKQNA